MSVFDCGVGFVFEFYMVYSLLGEMDWVHQRS